MWKIENIFRFKYITLRNYTDERDVITLPEGQYPCDIKVQLQICYVKKFPLLMKLNIVGTASFGRYDVQPPIPYVKYGGCYDTVINISDTYRSKKQFKKRIAKRLTDDRLHANNGREWKVPQEYYDDLKKFKKCPHTDKCDVFAGYSQSLCECGSIVEKPK